MDEKYMYVILMQSQMMSGQHSDPETRTQRCVQEAADDRLILQMLENKHIYY